MGINLVQAAFVLSLVMSLYFLALFFAEKKGRSDYLNFAIICIAVCLSYLNVTIHYEANDEVFLEALSKAGLVLLSPSCSSSARISRFFRQRKIFLRVMLVLGALSAAFVLIQRSKAAILGNFGLIMNFLIVPSCFWKSSCWFTRSCGSGTPGSCRSWAPSWSSSVRPFTMSCS
jgi:hypothetical protein